MLMSVTIALAISIVVWAALYIILARRWRQMDRSPTRYSPDHYNDLEICLAALNIMGFVLVLAGVILAISLIREWRT